MRTPLRMVVLAAACLMLSVVTTACGTTTDSATQPSSPQPSAPEVGKAPSADPYQIHVAVTNRTQWDIEWYPLWQIEPTAKGLCEGVTCDMHFDHTWIDSGQQQIDLGHVTSETAGGSKGVEITGNILDGQDPKTGGPTYATFNARNKAGGSNTCTIVSNNPTANPTCTIDQGRDAHAVITLQTKAAGQ